jgi:hypothetical protein
VVVEAPSGPTTVTSADIDRANNRHTNTKCVRVQQSIPVHRQLLLWTNGLMLLACVQQLACCVLALRHVMQRVMPVMAHTAVQLAVPSCFEQDDHRRWSGPIQDKQHMTHQLTATQDRHTSRTRMICQNVF